MNEWLFTAMTVLATGLFGLVCGYLLKQYLTEAKVKSAKTQADTLLAEAQTKYKEMILAAEDEALKIRDEAEAEAKKSRISLQRQEGRLQNRRETLDRKLERVEPRERKLDQRPAVKFIEGNLRDQPPVRRTAHTSLFMMMPFGEEYDVLEGALRQVLEEDPYFFQVILARDRTFHPNLFENVKAHMRVVHGFVADVSDLNPNVMLELGIPEADAEERPVVILRRSGSKEPPADLRGRLYVEYDLPPKEGADPVHWLAAQLREKFDDIEAVEQLRQNRTVRYLSATHLQRKFGQQRLTREEAKRLRKAFSTIEELESADKATIKQKTGLDDFVAAMVEAAF